jgi:hypothetical protein
MVVEFINTFFIGEDIESLFEDIKKEREKYTSLFNKRNNFYVIDEFKTSKTYKEIDDNLNNTNICLKDGDFSEAHGYFLLNSLYSSENYDFELYSRLFTLYEDTSLILDSNFERNKKDSVMVCKRTSIDDKLNILNKMIDFNFEKISLSDRVSFFRYSLLND